MIGLLVLGIAAALVWKFVVPDGRFLRGFSELLIDPKMQRGPLSFLTGRSYLTGSFQGRIVAVRLQIVAVRLQKTWRGRRPGYLVVAVQTSTSLTLDYTGIETHARDKDGGKALFAAAVHDLQISVEQGWLKAMWKPYRFGGFPGRWSDEEWRKVLEAMHALALSLERTSPRQP